MLYLVEEMRNYTHAWPFLEAVDAEEVADYYEIIKEPMGRYIHVQIYDIWTELTLN